MVPRSGIIWRSNLTSPTLDAEFQAVFGMTRPWGPSLRADNPPLVWWSQEIHYSVISTLVVWFGFTTCLSSPTLSVSSLFLQVVHDGKLAHYKAAVTDIQPDFFLRVPEFKCIHKYTNNWSKNRPFILGVVLRFPGFAFQRSVMSQASQRLFCLLTNRVSSSLVCVQQDFTLMSE